MSSNVNNSYDSANDSGDDLFAQEQPVASIPTHYLTATQFVTQPTQPLSMPLYGRQASTPPRPTVQVRASSPLQQSTPDPISQSRLPQKGPRPAPMQQGALNRGIGQSIAPPGTSFRNPVSTFSQNPSQVARSATFSDDEKAVPASDSDEDELQELEPSWLKRNGQPLVPPRFSHFAYDGDRAGYKRSSDAMADAYASRERSAKIARMEAPENPMQADLNLEDVGNWDRQQDIVAIRTIFPEASIRLCNEAMTLKRGNKVDAMDWIGNELSRREKSNHVVDLTHDDEAKPVRSFKKPGSKPVPVRRDAQNTKSIAQKWSSISTSKAAQPPPSPAPMAVMQFSPTAEASPVKPRKRLVQGRRVASPISIPSSPVLASAPLPTVAAPASAPTRRKVQTVDSDDEESATAEDDDSDSGIEIASGHDNELENKVLNLINTCSARDLVDVSNQPIQNAELIVAKRPFTELSEVRAIYIESKTTTKTGKARMTKQQIGDRLVEASLDTYRGYKAVDQLVAKCEQLGKPIAKELQQWGFTAFGTSQELEMVDLPDQHDSGIGTPTSSIGDTDELPRLGQRKKAFLQQPSLMSRDLVMKDYQVTGLNWLALLYQKKLSCILADDMGLGKTCQVIAFLSHLYEIGVKGPHLIVVLGSTLENWLREFKTFSPALRVEPYYGSKAERPEMRIRIESELAEINVIVTTYTLAASPADASFLRHLRPVCCVYDEGHALKNSASQRYKELMRIPAQFRLLLTGTPLQNNLQELVSLLAFIMPSIFRDQQENLQYIFKQKAKTTDDDHGNLLSAQRIKRARSMMTPFILRRKKHQVLKHLPAKHTRVQYCTLTASQTAIYSDKIQTVKAVLQQRQQEAATKGKGKPSAARASTNILMELRKAAIHPLLFRRRFDDKKIRKMAMACLQLPEYAATNDGPETLIEDLSIMTDWELDKFCEDPSREHVMSRFAIPSKDEPWSDSGKVRDLVDLLRTYIPNGDRTLVFSQFQMVMNILEDVFTHEGITFCRLDGNTKTEDRQELIDDFYRDESIKVFMLSTKAGGTGINLACANKVVIFDGSFNPSDDIQAENRAHRVGQTREVEVVRLVSKDTVEENIHKLGETKKLLDERVAGEGVDVDKAESKAIAMVEDMLMGDLLEGTKQEKDEGVEVLSCQDSGGFALKVKKEIDVNDEYMHGLKSAGLKMAV